ncbi:MAG: stage III sporulation protein AD [Firmicutes bacterium]|nr:stage III sporulation protein AD [Bacillota bacterium]
MSVLQIVLLAVVAALLISVVREFSPQVALFLTLFVATALLVIALGKLVGVLAPIEKLAADADVNTGFFETIIKIIGIAYIAELGAEIARDAGVSSVAGKVELVAKLFIVVLAVPVITAVVQTVHQLLP